MCPNWCECDLVVKGKKEDIDKFVEFAKGKGTLFDFNKFIPYPKKFRELDRKANGWRKLWEKSPEELTYEEKAIVLKNPKPTHIDDGYNQGGYEWCIQSWGTKWNACEVDIEDDYSEKERVYHFQTAWSPPGLVIKKAGEMFPELDFELQYFEGGVGFKGVLKIKAGKVEIDESEEYSGDRGG